MNAHTRMMSIRSAGSVVARRVPLKCLAAVLAVTAGASAVQATEARYACSGGTKLVAKFSPPSTGMGSVTLTFSNGETTTLPQTRSADGGRYAAKNTTFWIKGRSATLTRAGAREACATR